MLAVLILVVAIPLALVVGWATMLALAGRRRQTLANQVVPGVVSAVPRSWAGAHSPEAKLHRRLRDVVAGLRALPGADGPSLVDGRAAVERYVLALDERLVAAAALPESVREQPLAEITRRVDQLERAVAELASKVTTDDAALEPALRELSEGLAHLAEANAELDQLLRPERGPEPGTA